jgi:hypothetical protein
MTTGTTRFARGSSLFSTKLTATANFPRVINARSVAAGCTLTATTITRFSGSWIADGVAVGCGLSGTGIPGGFGAPVTTVTVVTSPTVLTTNGGMTPGSGITVTVARLNELVYPGAPATQEDPAFPLENLLNSDRSSVWSTGPTPADPLRIQLDLGGDKAVALLGLHGLRAGILPNQLLAGYRTAAQGYAASTYTALPVQNFTSGPRDTGQVLFPVVTGRYWQLELDSFGIPYALANPLLAAITNDLGIVYSPGSTDTYLPVVARDRTAGGMPVVTQLGDDRRELVMLFNNVDQGIRNALLLLAKSRAPVTYVDAFDQFQQIILTTDRLQIAHTWGPVDRYDVTLEAEVLG